MADLNEILEERGARYGRFVDHATTTMQIKSVFGAVRARRGFEVGFADDQLEALDMIAHKLGRILEGDPHYSDSWRDIAGYAQLVADRLDGESR